MRILSVEDDIRCAELISSVLEKEGYAVDTASTGEEGEALSKVFDYDLLLLDVMLPGKDGLAVLRDLRACHRKCPVLILSARDQVEDKIRGLDSGADDYLAKPFAIEELVSRIRTLLRRSPEIAPTTLRLGNLVLNKSNHQVCRGDELIELNPKEYGILELLMSRPNVVIDRLTMEQHVWNQLLDSSSNLVDEYIKRLRRKIGGDYIKTVSKVGYRLVAMPTTVSPNIEPSSNIEESRSPNYII